MLKVKERKKVKKKKNMIFSPKKHLGQNFIFDKTLLQKILNNCLIEDDSLVIEVGSGYGDFTRMLVEKKCRHVFSLEKDERLFSLLTQKKESEKITFLLQDALKVNWDSFCNLYNEKECSVSIVGNLAYNIANSLVIELLFVFQLFNSFSFLVQEEVAYRWVAKPKERNYSAISVFIDFFSFSKIKFVVSGTVFVPISSVRGALVVFVIKKKRVAKTSEVKEFWGFLRNCFQCRRKTLFNNLIRFSNYSIEWKDYYLRKEYSLKIRPSDLTAEEYWDFFLFFKKQNGLKIQEN